MSLNKIETHVMDYIQTILCSQILVKRKVLLIITTKKLDLKLLHSNYNPQEGRFAMKIVCGNL